MNTIMIHTYFQLNQYKVKQLKETKNRGIIPQNFLPFPIHENQFATMICQVRTAQHLRQRRPPNNQRRRCT